MTPLLQSLFARRAGKSRHRACKLGVELLEDRTVPTVTGDTLATAPLTTFPVSGHERISDTIDTITDVDIVAVDLVAGQILEAAIDGPRETTINIFDGQSSSPLASAVGDIHNTLPPSLAFTAPITARYYVAVSANDNTSYDPTVADSGNGTAVGVYGLILRYGQPELVTTSFHILEDAADWGGTVNVSFQIQNRSEKDATAFQAQICLTTNPDNAGPLSLTTIDVGPLAAGQSRFGTVSVTLPGTIDNPWADSNQDVYLMMVVDPDNSVAETLEGNNANQVGGIDVHRLIVSARFSETENNDGPYGQANAITPYSYTIGTLLPNDVDYYAFDLPESGQLAVQIHDVYNAGTPLRLALRGENNQLLLTSDTGTLQQHLAAGHYYVVVTAANQSAGGTYELNTHFTPAQLPFEPLPIGRYPRGLVSADFNNDDILDLVTGLDDNLDTVSIQFGLDDGTFRREVRYSFSGSAHPTDLATGDFDADGNTDLVISFSHAETLVLLGNGDGSFREPVGLDPNYQHYINRLAVGDFNNDNHLDIATADTQHGDDPSAQLTLYLGNGDGTFQLLLDRYAAENHPEDLVTADVDGDGNLDLIVSSLTFAGSEVVGSVVFLYHGRGDGTFEKTWEWRSTRPYLSDIVVDDFDGDAHVDLTVGLDTTILVFFGAGQDHFDAATALFSDNNVTYGALAGGDLNQDGQADLVFTNQGAKELIVFLGQTDQTFRELNPVLTEVSLWVVVLADYNRDGLLDVAGTADVPHSTTPIELLYGAGSGLFQSTGTKLPTVPLFGDFDDDGLTDLVNLQARSDGGYKVTVQLGANAGSDLPPRATNLDLAFNTYQDTSVTGDFNNDGRTDLILSGYNAHGPLFVLLLGLGDGTFIQTLAVQLEAGPAGFLAADYNEDGRLDLLVVSELVDTVGNVINKRANVWLGKPDGTFAQAPGSYFFQLAVQSGDWDGDGHPDLAVTTDDTLTPLYGTGTGSFIAGQSLTFNGAAIEYFHSGDYNGDGRADLNVTFVAQQAPAQFLFGTVNRTFDSELVPFPNLDYYALVAGDLSGGDRIDYAAISPHATENRFFLNLAFAQGDGTFVNSEPISVGDNFYLGIADFNGDGRMDLFVTGGSHPIIYYSLGSGNFRSSEELSQIPAQATPQWGDLNNDGAADVVLVARTGDILVRYGRVNQPGTFDPPFIVNAGPPALAVAIVQTADRPVLAAIDLDADRVRIYQLSGAAPGTELQALNTGALPTAISSADVNGDGLGDFAVVEAGWNRVLVFFQSPDGSIDAPLALGLDVGAAPANVLLTDLDGKNGADVVVSSHLSGDVSVYLNNGSGGFEGERRYRAGAGLYGVSTATQGPLSLLSREGSLGLDAADYNEDGCIDLLVSNRKSNQFAILPGTGNGGFLAPVVFQSEATPSLIRTGDFNADGHADVLLLSDASDQLALYLGDGQGGFQSGAANSFAAGSRAAQPTATLIAAGNKPSGFSLADTNGDGTLDLLVGNELGDLLLLHGNGDGTFQSYERADRSVALAVADLDGDGRSDFVFANESLDRVAVQYAGQQWSQDRDEGLLAPGAVSLVDLNGDGAMDLVVANQGGNSLLVYAGDGTGQFGARQEFFVGTSPTAVVSADLNGDSITDLVVANQGSNDVSVLLGSMQQSLWTVGSELRQQAGSGPTDISLRDVVGQNGSGGPDGFVDLLVSNGQADNVQLIPGVGDGFFNSGGGSTFDVGATPEAVFVGNFDGLFGLDLATINSVGNSVTLISNFVNAPVRTDFDSGGFHPVTAASADLNRDGFDDLVVGNNGDGAVALFLGSDDGLALAEIFTRPDLLHPTDLALLVQGGDSVTLFVTEEGREAVVRFDLLLRTEDSTATFEVAELDEAFALESSVPASVQSSLFLLPERKATDAKSTDSSKEPALNNFVTGLEEPGAAGSGENPGNGGGEELTTEEAMVHHVTETIDNWFEEVIETLKSLLGGVWSAGADNSVAPMSTFVTGQEVPPTPVAASNPRSEAPYTPLETPLAAIASPVETVVAPKEVPPVQVAEPTAAQPGLLQFLFGTAILGIGMQRSRRVRTDKKPPFNVLPACFRR